MYDKKDPPQFSPELIFENETHKPEESSSPQNPSSPSESDYDLPPANVPDITACLYCRGKNIVKRGKRHKKHEVVQLYFCHDCERTFTGQTLKGKKYPARLILDGVSYYNVGFSLEDTVRFLQQSYGLKSIPAPSPIG